MRDFIAIDGLKNIVRCWNNEVKVKIYNHNNWLDAGIFCDKNFIIGSVTPIVKEKNRFYHLGMYGVNKIAVDKMEKNSTITIVTTSGIYRIKRKDLLAEKTLVSLKNSKPEEYVIAQLKMVRLDEENIRYE